MVDLQEFKAMQLDRLHKQLGPVVASIRKNEGTSHSRASAVNDAVWNHLVEIREELREVPDPASRQLMLITLEYCGCVVSLEYRHSVWPYEYMAFSRRVGELWERFCKACWEEPARPAVERVEPPRFQEVMTKIRGRLEANIAGLPEVERKLVSDDLNDLISLIGDINMREDEVTTVDGNLVVVDFKSGFGSNEKGNTLRLLAVANAYRLHDPNTKLYLLVRQTANNRYLEVLRASQVWEVYSGDAAYEKIAELTGADILRARREIVDFESDLSPALLKALAGQATDLRSYLAW